MANKFCTHCGSKLEGRFCNRCGADMGMPAKNDPVFMQKKPLNIGGESSTVAAKRSKCTYTAMVLFSVCCMLIFIATLGALHDVESSVSAYGISYSKLWFVLLLISAVGFALYSVYSIIINKCGAKKMMSIILIFLIAAVIEFILILIVEDNVSESVFRTAANAFVSGQVKFGMFSSVSIYIGLRAYLTAIVTNVFVMAGIIASFVLSIVGMSLEKKTM